MEPPIKNLPKEITYFYKGHFATSQKYDFPIIHFQTSEKRKVAGHNKSFIRRFYRSPVKRHHGHYSLQPVENLLEVLLSAGVEEFVEPVQLFQLLIRQFLQR